MTASRVSGLGSRVGGGTAIDSALSPRESGPGTRNPEPLAEVLDAASAGQGLPREWAYRLIRAEGQDLDALLRAASALRDRRTGRTITYSRKVFIPLTNLCRDQCGYCTFVRRPGDPKAHTMTPEEVLAVAQAGRRAGCKEALFSLGDKPERRYTFHRQWLGQQGYDSTLAYLRDMCALVLERTGLLPHANPGAMDDESIGALRDVNVSLGMMVESLSPRLFQPGGAHRGCPDKLPRPRLATLEAAGRLQVPFTTGILIGIGETPEERVEALLAIKQANDRYGHVQEVIVQNFRAKPDIAMRDWPEPDTQEMLRTAAVARLLLGPEINLQAPPNLTPEGYPLYLRAGINDWGGVSPVTLDCINPELAWPALEELSRNTEAAGFELRERLAIYPEFALQPDRFLATRLHQPVQRWVDETGLVRPYMEQW